MSAPPHLSVATDVYGGGGDAVPARVVPLTVTVAKMDAIVARLDAIVAVYSARIRFPINACT